MKVREVASLALSVGAGLAVGGVLLWLAVRNVDLDQVWQTLLFIDTRWLIAGIAIYALALLSRIVRWWIIMHGVVEIRLGQVAAALLAGYAVNAILPARLGELFRANFCGRRYGISRAIVLGTIMIERFTDGIIVLCALVVGLVAVRIEGEGLAVLQSVLIVGLLVFGAFGMVLLLLRTNAGVRLFARYPRIALRFDGMSASLQQLHSWRMVGVLGLSVVVWLFDGAALWAVLNACHVDPTFFGMCLVVGVVSLSTLLPSPPGFVGTMQFAFAFSVSFLGYPQSQGIAAATANQVFLLGPMIVVGLAILAWAYLRSLGSRRRSMFRRKDVAETLS